MMKYLFNVIFALSITCPASATIVVVFINSSIPINSLEFYQPQMGADWITLNYTYDQVYDGLDYQRYGVVVADITEFQDFYVRFNSDDSFVFSLSPLENPDVLGVNVFTTRMNLTLEHGGLVVRVSQYLSDAVGDDLLVLDDTVAQLVLNPLLVGADGIQVDPRLSGETLVRAAIYEIYTREIARMWVLVLPMFGVGLIWFIRTRTQRLAGGGK